MFEVLFLVKNENVHSTYHLFSVCHAFRYRNLIGFLCVVPDLFYSFVNNFVQRTSSPLYYCTKYLSTWGLPVVGFDVIMKSVSNCPGCYTTISLWGGNPNTNLTGVRCAFCRHERGTKGISIQYFKWCELSTFEYSFPWTSRMHLFQFYEWPVVALRFSVKLAIDANRPEAQVVENLFPKTVWRTMRC